MNAIIMAAGMSSRFVPLCWERPKALLAVNGEILIERQIRQLEDAGISDITVVVGYMAEKFDYLKDKYGVSVVVNPDYARFNNTSTLMCVLDRLGDTWLCSSDNYFTENVFVESPSESMYAAEYAKGETNEYCLSTDEHDRIVAVSIGGKDAWYMIGHVFINQEFANAFKIILRTEYSKERVKAGYWEDVYIAHMHVLPAMRIRRYAPGVINEFDTLADLQKFDKSYNLDTHSIVVRNICERLNCRQCELTDIRKLQVKDAPYSFSFVYRGVPLMYKAKDWSSNWFEISKI